ncbi:MAG: radical protein [Planctomycetaceae bacterium]|nr:radical protein [Planctomycetaceae bacterium]
MCDRLEDVPTNHMAGRMPILRNDRPMISAPRIFDRDIIAARGGKNRVDPWQPYAFLVEPEHAAGGLIEDVATIFLTNRECPFHCLMCDLWKNTLDTRVPDGAIPAQIDFALERLPAAQHIKLYNSANFFDPQSIPRDDWPAIAEQVRSFKTVIVENHPRLCTDDCRIFRDLTGTQLEVALGLETIHPDVLPRLNKQMTVDDFESAVSRLRDWDILTRAFILLRPPYLTEEEGIEWACRSIEFAFDCGVNCASVIPVRGGNGIMEHLAAEGLYSPPSLRALEDVLDYGLQLHHGRVFVDLWDGERFATCPECGPPRRARLERMNLSQVSEARVKCQNCD